MTKITVDKALIEQAIEAAFSPYCAQDLGILVPALREALAEPAVEPVDIDQIAAGRYKVVPAHESMFHRWAVVAGNGTQQLYLGRELECQNMARKFAGAFLDGAYLASPPPPAEVPLLTTDEYTTLAHRIASKYAHRSDPQHIAYTFLPHTLEQFARAIEQAVRQNAGLK